MASSAAVIGGSMAGLLAARALSPHFERVVVFERDELPDVPGARKGVPQARHVHVLLAAGANTLEEFLPGLFDDIAREGGTTVDMSARNNWFHFGSWKRRLVLGMHVHIQSRDLLELAIRRRVLALGNVEARHVSVERVSWENQRPHVEGQAFDLLVDASGRGSRMPTWLSAAGFEAPREERVGVDVSYTTARYRSSAPRDWGALLIYPNPPRERRAGGVFPIEGDLVLASMMGWCGDKSEPNDAAFAEYARSLPQPEVSDFLKHAERVSDFSAYTFREARLRHYAQLAKFPARTLVLGDALCSFDPVFGQGMTVAALSARILSECARAVNGDAERLASDFRKRVGSAWKVAWELSTTEDFRYAEVSGKRPLGTSFAHWYTQQVHRLTALDDDVYRRFALVMNLLEPPTILFHPSVVAKVAGEALRPEPAVIERPREPS